MGGVKTYRRVHCDDCRCHKRIEALEWLREVEQFKLTYAWPKWWGVQCTKAICELNEIHAAALEAVK